MENFEVLLLPHVGRPALYDANLLLLYLIAKFDPSIVSSFKRLNTFEREDISLLASLSQRFSSISTTPHVLTEVGNLANQLPAHTKARFLPWFGEWLAQFAEIFVEARILGKLESFQKFGITDSALAHLASHYVILTVDSRLAAFLEGQQLRVINFTHLRAAWLFR